MLARRLFRFGQFLVIPVGRNTLEQIVVLDEGRDKNRPIWGIQVFAQVGDQRLEGVEILVREMVSGSIRTALLPDESGILRL